MSTKPLIKKTESKGVSDVIKTTTGLGDKFNDKWLTEENMKAAGIALAAYRSAITGAKAQAQYNKDRGNKKKISFFEH